MAFANSLTAYHRTTSGRFMTANSKGADVPKTFYDKLKARL